MRARRIAGPEADRFWAKVDFDGPGGCWLWTAATRPDGYGIFRRADGTNIRAHRWAYEQIIGPHPPEAPHTDHLCRNRACVRPDHLEAVTNATNAARSQPGGRSWRRDLTHCKWGHEFSPENIYWHQNPGGSWSRGCRACRNGGRPGR